MKIAWVTRSFLDYRIPVFKELDALVEGGLNLLYAGDYVPQSVQKKAARVLGPRAMPLTGEWRIGREDRDFLANRNVSLRIHPGVFGRIRGLKPDVMVCDGFFKWTVPALLHRIQSGTPLVICYERWAHTERLSQWYRKLYRKMVIRFADAMCCNGSLSAAYANQLGMPSNRITRGQMAADTDGLAAARERIPAAETSALKEKLGLCGTILLYVGRLVQLKGLDRLMDAWARLEPNLAKKSGLLIAGDGPERGALERQCRDLGLVNVVFVGAVAHDRIAAYYATADAFVIPTLEDNWSLVVPEAMACGLPVLCSKYNGCWPELVREGENGWVFDPVDSRDFVRTLQAAVDAGDRLREMGKCSREIVAAHSPGNAAEAIISACRIAVSAKQNRRRNIPCG
jgi:glycosyltransferase involved in cell wall biosynthesis